MNQLLVHLARKNRFKYQKLNPHNLPGDKLTAEMPLVHYAKEHIRNDSSIPFVLLKHHLPFSFKKYGIQQPTYINVLRDPVDWFQSHYYFERFGWEREKGDRNSFSGTEKEKNQIIDDCVIEQSDQFLRIQKAVIFLW